MVGKYVIVDNPFPPWDVPWLERLRTEQRQQNFSELVAVWFLYMLRREGESAQSGKPSVKAPIEYIYRQNTKRAIIVKFYDSADVDKVVGRHLSHFCFMVPHAPVIDIFPYNSRRHGDPGENQWSTILVPEILVPNIKKAPIVRPYPVPSWRTLQRTSTDLVSLQVPLKVPANRPPTPDPRPRSPTPPPPPPPPPAENLEPKVEQELKQEACVSDLVQPPPEAPSFVPYERPGNAPTPSPVEVHDEVRVKKMDPYEEEELAQLFIKSEPVEADLPPVRVKPEPIESSALDGGGLALKAEDSDSEPVRDMAALAQLANYIKSHGSEEAQPARVPNTSMQVKREQIDANLRTGSQHASPPFGTFNDRQMAGSIFQASPQHSQGSTPKRIKTEEVQPSLQDRNKVKRPRRA